MNILVLGGTAFLGRAVVEEALRRGHEVTCAARGSSPAPAGAQFVALDRDLDNALRPVARHTWDAVVDVSRQPGQVRRAVGELDTPHYILVSSSNVYARFDRLEKGEDSPLLDPLDGDVMADMSAYGPAKVACEEAVRSGATSSTIIRSGLIVGPGDPFGRGAARRTRFRYRPRLSPPARAPRYASRTVPMAPVTGGSVDQGKLIQRSVRFHT